MFTTTITHKDLSEAGLLITEGFRGYKASPELIKLSKRAESFARASVTADHDLAGLYDYGQQMEWRSFNKCYQKLEN